MRASYNFPVSYRLGAGRLAELPAVCAERGIARPLVVTDPGVARLDWFGRLRASLDAAGLAHTVWSDVVANPVEANVVGGVDAYRQGACDGVVLVGGGSALDVGKCVALMVGNPGSVFDYEDVGDNWTRVDPDAIPPMIAVPTTAGTGSEVGRASVIVDPEHVKRIIFHPKMQPPVVIADPEVTYGLPRHITAWTGMDALAHSLEAFCAPGFHPMADGIALEGMRLVHLHLRTACDQPTHVEARTAMLVAAAMGATAFQKGLGLVHALAHPLGGATDVHHGLSNAILMPYVLAFNRPVIEDRMVRLARHLELDDVSFDGVMAWMLTFRHDLGIPHTLAAVDGFDAAMARRLAPLAKVDPSMGSNPRDATVAEIEGVFLAALHGELP